MHEDPVLFLEHKHLLRQPYTKDPFPDPGYVLPFGRGRYVTRGTDLTIVQSSPGRRTSPRPNGIT